MTRLRTARHAGAATPAMQRRKKQKKEVRKIGERKPQNSTTAALAVNAALSKYVDQPSFVWFIRAAQSTVSRRRMYGGRVCQDDLDKTLTVLPRVLPSCRPQRLKSGFGSQPAWFATNSRALGSRLGGSGRAQASWGYLARVRRHRPGLSRSSMTTTCHGPCPVCAAAPKRHVGRPAVRPGAGYCGCARMGW